MDSITPLHLVLIAAIVTLVLGPARAGRVAGRVVGWLRTYRQLSGRLTPAGLAQALYQAAAAPPGDRGAGAGPTLR